MRHHRKSPEGIAERAQHSAAALSSIAFRYLASGHPQVAANFQHLAHERANEARFNLLLALYGDADAAEEAFDGL